MPPGSPRPSPQRTAGPVSASLRCGDGGGITSLVAARRYAWLEATMTRFRARRASSQELKLAVVGEAGLAGAPVCGEVSGPAGPATVSLLRVERSPAGTFAFVLNSCRVALEGGRAQFEFAASRTLAPAIVGERCRLAD